MKNNKYNDVISIMRNLVRNDYNQNDVAHQIHHADEVASRAILYTSQALKDVPFKEVVIDNLTRMAIVAAYAHDVGCHIDRKTHHDIAGDWVLANSKLLSSTFGFNDDELYYIALACRQHRASYKGKHETLLSEIISCADRGAPPVDPMVYFKRSYIFARDKQGMCPKDSVKHAVSHIVEKFNPDTGYVNYPPLYYKLFKEELDTFNENLNIVIKEGAYSKRACKAWDEAEKKYAELKEMYNG